MQYLDKSIIGKLPPTPHICYLIINTPGIRVGPFFKTYSLYMDQNMGVLQKSASYKWEKRNRWKHGIEAPLGKHKYQNNVF